VERHPRDPPPAVLRTRRSRSWGCPQMLESNMLAVDHRIPVARAVPATAIVAVLMLVAGSATRYPPGAARLGGRAGRKRAGREFVAKHVRGGLRARISAVGRCCSMFAKVRAPDISFSTAGSAPPPSVCYIVVPLPTGPLAITGPRHGSRYGLRRCRRRPVFTRMYGIRMEFEQH
jgi:hypothetical protein